MKMFPQSELDNYKLQVELLQERLQRSEISRQQLEHKLDKILQKRDEHDKLVRSKARQKYQLFLEEQQRRNERNKQLVQMLERIEQQTEVMNARSERLKMMKLQYEMYFAKLVHSQTRRCIQHSINPMAQMTQVMPSPSIQATQATVRQSTLEGQNYDTNIETPTPTMFYPYHSYASTSLDFRSQPENIAMKTTELPTLANFLISSKSDCSDLRNFEVDPRTPAQQSNAEYLLKAEAINNISNNTDIPENISCFQQETPEKNSYLQNNASLSSVTNLSPKDKQFSELKENSNLSTTASSIFEEIPNLAMMKQHPNNLRDFPSTTNRSTKSSNNATHNNNDTLNHNENLQPLQSTKNMRETPVKYLNENEQSFKVVKPVPQEARDELKSPIISTQNKFETHDATMPNLTKKPLTSLELEASRNVIETSQKSSNYDNRKTKPTKQIKNEGSVKNTESISSTAPVSIENIENEIYGELLSPLENTEVQKPENPNVVPELLENLITESENVESKDIPSEEPIVGYDSPINRNLVKDSNETESNSQQNYEQAAAYNDYNSSQPGEDLSQSFVGYTNYENVDGTAVDESQQQQQQQQYDYSNYDPTQYSYPGYIYDETTGEYKPDPNAPAEQYATDQQYSSESYDQQQYQQQNYDYNQIYADDPAVTSTTESTAYNNYDAQQQETSPNLIASEIEEKQQTISTIESNNPQPDLRQEEAPTTSTKVLKPTSILSTTEKNDTQKKKKRVNFIDSSETDESAAAEKGALPTAKTTTGNVSGSSESDFEFPSSAEAEAKAT